MTDHFTHRRCGQRVAEVPPMDEHDDDTGLWCARCGMYLRDDEVEPEPVEEPEAFDEATGPTGPMHPLGTLEGFQRFANGFNRGLS